MLRSSPPCPMSFPEALLRVGIHSDRTQYIPMDGSGKGPGRAGSGAGSS